MTATLARCLGLASLAFAVFDAGCDPSGGSSSGVAASREGVAPHEAVLASPPSAGSSPEAGAKSPKPAAESQSPGAIELAGRVDPKRLKALLPDSLAGLKRTNTKTEHHGAAPSGVSLAEADYESAPDTNGAVKSLTIRLSDFAARDELPAPEADASSIKVIAADRFLVEVEGRNVKPEELKAALGKIDIAKLASMTAAEASK